MDSMRKSVDSLCLLPEGSDGLYDKDCDERSCPPDVQSKRQPSNVFRDIIRGLYDNQSGSQFVKENAQDETKCWI